ncbi:unnamed protein product [Ranitomeya imitator]|uniref:Heterogeneous nuclear ribonucleoprotein L RRM domain-containing protein n=1 Tax=Ranitomeya imitator TaxID=111125 RepID=A0ABN9LEV5_9NEOB|nr:unnamed protein product [Ranitomeya imitator]
MSLSPVKFMKTIPGTALVEMGDEYAVERAVTHLNNVKVFGKRLNVCVSKQHSVVPSQIFELEDGASSYKDFAMSKNNRFTSAGQASKNIIQPPSCVLHYYNVPLCMEESIFQKLCEDHQVPKFIKYKVFDAKLGNTVYVVGNYCLIITQSVHSDSCSRRLPEDLILALQRAIAASRWCQLPVSLPVLSDHVALLIKIPDLRERGTDRGRASDAASSVRGAPQNTGASLARAEHGTR